MPTAESTNWRETVQQLLHHYVPPFEPSAALIAACAVLFIAGLYLVFRGAKSERHFVGCFAFLVGGFLGWKLSDWIGTPGPISMAVVGVILTVIAYRTSRLWLAGGSVLFLFLAALALQLGRGDLTRYLPSSDSGTGPVDGVMIPALSSAEDQYRRLHDQASVQLEQLLEKIGAEMKNLGPLGWMIPLAGAIIGGILAYRALRIFTVIWMALIGAGLAVLSALTFSCAEWPDLRKPIFAEPRLVLGAIVALWLAGLIWQAKEARLPKRTEKPAEAAAKPTAQS